MISVNSNKRMFSRSPKMQVVAVKNKGKKVGWTIYLQQLGDDSTRTYLCQAMSPDSRDYMIRIHSARYGIAI